MEAGTQPGLANVGAVPASSPGLFFSGVPDGTYYVRVRATNASGSSPPSSDLVLSVGCAGAPAAPTTLNSSVAGSLVGLNWNVEPGTVSTLVEVGYGPGQTALTASFAAPTAGLSVNAPPATYYVRVRAVNACGQSAPSVERTIVVP
jgi:predicted phage tail protein